VTTVAVIVLLGSYLLGSVLFGVVVLRAATGADPRVAGSGNPGATNVMRIAGKRWGAAALALDAGKGAAAVLFTRWLAPGDGVLPAAAALAVVLGHLFPVFYGFRGGKGVATGWGAFLALSYQPAWASVAVFVIVLTAFRFVSLASIAAAMSLAPWCWWWGAPPAVTGTAALVGMLVVVRHRANLRRLREGVEPRFGDVR